MAVMLIWNNNQWKCNSNVIILMKIMWKINNENGE